MSSTPPRIAVVGSLNTDLVIRTPRMPRPGETLTGGDFFIAQGGKGANQAVAAARQGAAVTMIGCIGADDFGAAQRAAMLAEGIDDRGLRTMPGTSTGVAVILLDDDRQNSIVVSPGANAAVSPEWIAECAALLTSSAVLLCQMETPADGVAEAMRRARAAGCRVIFNPAPASWSAQSLVALADILVVNESEAAMLSGFTVIDEGSAVQAAEALAARCAGGVLVTLGGRGLVARVAGTTSRHPAFAVTPLDTTAAGDTFVGAFAVAMAGGLPLGEAVTRAQAAAALSVTRLGAQPSIPTAAEVDAFLAATRRPEG